MQVFNISYCLRSYYGYREGITSLFITRFEYTRIGVPTLSAVWGLLPLGTEESDLVMLLFALFILAVLVIAMFMFFPWYYAVLGTGLIVFGIYYGVRELRKQENQSD